MSRGRRRGRDTGFVGRSAFNTKLPVSLPTMLPSRTYCHFCGSADILDGTCQQCQTTSPVNNDQVFRRKYAKPRYKRL